MSMPLVRPRHEYAAVLVLLLLATTTEARSQSAEEGTPARRDTVVIQPDRQQSLQDRNKELARGFYQDLWFTSNTDRYPLYVADEYVVHDVGDRKGVTEPAVEQKNIADFLHSQGDMTGSIDFQIAEGDLVATRWQWKLEPKTFMFRIMGGRKQIPIINVFRFEDGKIVEIWNHRHDIDTGMANFKFVAGLAIGLLIALPGWILFFAGRRKRRRAARDPDLNSWELS